MVIAANLFILLAAPLPALPAAASPIPPVPVPVQAATPLPAMATVTAYYQTRANSPIWLRDAPGIAAAQRFVEVLRRAQLDGLAEGPRLAAEIEAAILRASALPPGGRMDQERLIAAAWVAYIQALRRPTTPMAFGDPALAPKLRPASLILAEAAKAPSLLAHVEDLSAVNPLYAQLRDAGWRQAGQGPAAAADPRLVANLERARLLPAKGRFILVDTASAQLWTYENGRPTDTMKVVVGKRTSPTPLIAGTIHYATFNPYWNIPSDVIRRVVAPLVLKRGVGYLKLAEYEVASDFSPEARVVPPDEIDWKAVAAGTTQIRIRQLPGPNNMMGKIKFGFVNDLGIYLHDTPERKLFDKPKRTFSLGCVRVEDAQRLARWLLQREPVAPSSEPEQHVQLAQGVPVFITYLTARAEGGQLSYSDDVYGFDPKPPTALVENAAADVPAKGSN